MRHQAVGVEVLRASFGHPLPWEMMMPGNFFWYDVLTADITAAAKFYGDVIGWTCQEMSQSGQRYNIFNVDGVGVAGLMAFPEGMTGHPHWNGYIAVDD